MRPSQNSLFCAAQLAIAEGFASAPNGGYLKSSADNAW
jgi:hypothetical protein